jgi:CHAT domain-containing protein
MRYLPLIFSILTFCYAQAQKSAAQKEYDLGIAEDKNNKTASGFTHFMNAVKLAEDNSELQLKAIFKVAHLYNYADDETKQKVVQLSLKGLRTVKRTNRKDTLAAHIYYRGARAFELDYQADSALMAYEEARKRYEVFYGKQSGRVADCYMLIGEVYRKVLHDFVSAEAQYEKALEIRERLPNDELNLYSVSLLYTMLSEANRRQRDYEKALMYASRNIEYAESIDYPYYLEWAYVYLGNICRDMGQYTKAIALYSKAVRINNKINKKNNLDLCYRYFDIAQTWQTAGMVKQAIENYNRGIEIFNSLDESKNARIINVFNQLGELYTTYDDSKALTSFIKALSLVNKYGLHQSGYTSALYKSMGDYFVKVNQLDSAMRYYQNALAVTANFNPVKDNPEIHQIRLKDYAYNTLLQKAKLLTRRYHESNDTQYANKALKSFALAEQLLTQSRIDLDTDESKWIFFDSNFELYEHAITLLFELHKKEPSGKWIDQAFAYMEASKAKMLADALNEVEFAQPLAKEDSTLQLIRIYKRNLHYLHDQLNEVNTENTVDSVRAIAIRNAMIEIDRKIQIAKHQVEDKYPAYHQVTTKSKIPQLNELKQYAQREHASLIEYFWGAKGVYALGIGNGNAQFEYLGSTDSIKAQIEPVLQFLQPVKNDYHSEAIIQFATNSNLLYRSLIHPFHLINKSTDRLMIIPDGLIGQLPFEVLNASSGKRSIDFLSIDYLLHSKIISYTFSSAYLLSKRNNTPSQTRMLAFGFTTGSQFRTSRDTAIVNKEIPGSEEELKLLADKFSNGSFYFGRDVTEKRFKLEASAYDLIHLAVHGQGDTEQNYSASLFFRDTVKSEEDGRLHWYELLGMNLKARLVVISSCESGIGKTYRGEGMLSMASAFAYAGCPNIVMGLWKVDDRVSVELMNEFYENLSEGFPVDESLARAKRTYMAIADELTANPKMWASLVAYGNQKVIDNQRNVILYKTGTILLILIIAAMIIRRYLGRERRVKQ